MHRCLLYFESLKIQMAWFHLLEEGRNVWAAQVTGLVFRGWRERWGVFVSRLHWRSKDKRNKKLLHGSLPPIWCVFIKSQTERETRSEWERGKVDQRSAKPKERAGACPISSPHPATPQSPSWAPAAQAGTRRARKGCQATRKQPSPIWVFCSLGLEETTTLEQSSG